VEELLSQFMNIQTHALNIPLNGVKDLWSISQCPFPVEMVSEGAISLVTRTTQPDTASQTNIVTLILVII
jgi:hypothetical protein